MKKLFTFLILLCTVFGAKAEVSVERLADGKIQLTTQNENELSSLTNDQKTLLRSAESLKIVGPLGSNDFLQLRDAGTAQKTVDLREAMLPQSTLKCTYKKDVHNNSEQGVTRTYSNTDSSFPPIITQGEVKYYLFYASTTDDCRLPERWANTLTTLSLPTDANYKIVNSNFCNGFSKLSSVTIPDNVKVIGNFAFQSCEALTSVNLNKVEYFCENSFYHPAIETLTIPGTTVYIGTRSFTDPIQPHGVKTLVFSASDDDPNHYMIVKETSFNNQRTINDVYINTTSEYICENWAFSMEMTYAHGDPNSSYTVLHFPSSVAEHYSNLKHPLTIDIAKSPALFHEWLLNHYSQAQATQNAVGNGWWEFVNTGTIDPTDDPVPGAKVLRTYSDYNYDRIVPRGLKAYIVTGLKSRDDGNYEVSLTQLLVIPKRTGVILYGAANSQNQAGQPIVSLQPVEIANGYPLRRDYWYKLTGDDVNYMKNYLWPTCVANDPDSIITESYNFYNLNSNGELVQNSEGGYDVHQYTRTVLGPKNKNSFIDPYDEPSKFSNAKLGSLRETGYDIDVLNGFFRNFYLNYYNLTDPGIKNSLDNDFIGFFRAKSSKTGMKTGHAYLRLEKEEYPKADGVEVIVNPDTKSPFIYSDKYGNTTTYNMKAYQVEYSINDGKPQLPGSGEGHSGLWGEDFVPNIIWEDPSNWGVRPSDLGVLVKYVGEPIIEDEDGHATMIIGPVQDNEVKDPYYYTIQGVKIAKPTVPGIYIHNGKKVVIK